MPRGLVTSAPGPAARNAPRALARDERTRVLIRLAIEFATWSDTEAASLMAQACGA
jgi:hypothetical protein